MPSNHLILCHPLLPLPSIFPSIRVFSDGQFFASGGQSIGVSAWASVLPMNIRDWFHYGNLRAFLINFLSTGAESKVNKPSWIRINSIQFSSVVSYSLWPHEPQHARPPCPSSTSGVYPNSCPLSWWCHPTILSSVIPFSSCPQSFPASGSFPMSQLFASGG